MGAMPNFGMGSPTEQIEGGSTEKEREQIERERVEAIFGHKKREEEARQNEVGREAEEGEGRGVNGHGNGIGTVGREKA